MISNDNFELHKWTVLELRCLGEAMFEFILYCFNLAIITHGGGDYLVILSQIHHW